MKYEKAARLVHVEPLAQHADVDALVDAAVSLEDEPARVLQEVVLAGRQEKVGLDHLRWESANFQLVDEY